jgi:hypothetical protein
MTITREQAIEIAKKQLTADLALEHPRKHFALLDWLPAEWAISAIIEASQPVADVQAEGSYPALPEPEVYHQDTYTEDQITGYDADQMRAFADATVAHRQQPSGWISVLHSLPPKNTEVLIAYDCSSLPATGQYTGDKRDVDGWCYPSEDRNIGPDNRDPIVTHWMTLPEVPAEAHRQQQAAAKGGE